MVSSQGTSYKGTRGAAWGFFEWVSGILGGIGVFVGLFVFFGGEDEYVGLGGDLSWRVGDISSAWAYGLLIGGMALLAVAVFLAILGRSRVRVEPTSRSDLILHAGIFAAVNAFVWIQDFAIGGGLDYALWVTIPWAFALVVHAGIHMFAPSEKEQQLSASEADRLQPH